MTDVIFARTRYQYDPYDDFFRLVELSGYPIIYVDEIDPDDRGKTYIYTPDNGETVNGWPGAKARIVHYALEWYTGADQYGAPMPKPEPRPGVAQTWTPDRWNAAQIGARFVPIGSHRGLKLRDEPRDVKYDLAFIGYTGPYRRNKLIGEFVSAGYSFAPNGWGEERHRALNGAQALLHIHQFDNVPTVPALRFAVAAAYGIPIITETIDDPAPFPRWAFVQARYEYLLAATRVNLGVPRGRLLDMGHALFQFLCVDHPFRSYIERAL